MPQSNPEYPIIIPHGYRRKIATEENGKMYVWTALRRVRGALMMKALRMGEHQEAAETEVGENSSA